MSTSDIRRDYAAMVTVTDGRVRCDWSDTLEVRFLAGGVTYPRGYVDLRVAAPLARAAATLAAVMKHHGYEFQEKAGGSCSCRTATGSTLASAHAYCAALDFNPSRNGYRRVVGALDEPDTAHVEGVLQWGRYTDMSPAMIRDIEAIRTEQGRKVWEWGGRWWNVKDAMHFQPAATRAELAVGIDLTTVRGWQAYARWMMQADPVDGVPGPTHPDAAVARWAWIVEQYFSPKDWAKAMRVMGCESAGHPYIDNTRSSARGLWQFLTGSADPWAARVGRVGQGYLNVFDPEANTWMAAKLLYGEIPAASRSWSHWACVYDYTNRRFRDTLGYTAAEWGVYDRTWQVPAFAPRDPIGPFFITDPLSRPFRDGLRYPAPPLGHFGGVPLPPGEEDDIMLRFGNRGEGVAQLQYFLRDLGHPPASTFRSDGTPDGVWGDGTKKAIIAAGAARGIPLDGLTFTTWTALRLLAKEP